MIINIIRFITCYGNPVIIAFTGVLYLFFSGYGDTEAFKSLGMLYALSAVIFSFSAIWVFSIGALIVLVQLIYGLVKYFTVKENRAVYLHYFYGFAVSIISYVIIFTISS